IARDAASGNFLIADNDNEELFALTPDGLSLTALNVSLGDSGPISVATDPPPPATQSNPSELTYVLTSTDGGPEIFTFPGGTGLNCGELCEEDTAYDFARDSSGNFILPMRCFGLIKLAPNGSTSNITGQSCDTDSASYYGSVAL